MGIVSIGRNLISPPTTYGGQLGAFKEITETAAKITDAYVPAPVGALLPDGRRIPSPGTENWAPYYGRQCADGTVEVIKGRTNFDLSTILGIEKVGSIYECPPLIPPPKPTPAPFRGGQCPTYYIGEIKIFFKIWFVTGGGGFYYSEETATHSVRILGPISSFSIELSNYETLSNNQSGHSTWLLFKHGQLTEQVVGGSVGGVIQFAAITEISLTREDGLPDNCGDPEGSNTGEPEPEIYPPPEPRPERPFDPYPDIKPFPIPFPIPVPLPIPTPTGFPFPFPMPIPTPPRLPEFKPMPIPFPIPKPDWIDLPPPWLEDIKNCPPPCPPLDLSPVIEAIARVKIEINNEFNLTLNARLDAQLQAILNLLASLEARLSTTLLLQLEPKFQAVLTAITSLELNLSAQVTNILTGILELNLNLNLKADLILQALLDVKIALLNAILSIEFSPTIQVDPVKEYEVIEKPVIVKDCEIVEKPVLITDYQVIEKPLVVKEYEIIETQKTVEVIKEKQPPLEQVLLPVVDCREDGSPEKRWQIVRTLVGAIPTSVQQQFQKTADLAEERCLEEADKGCTVVLPSDCYSEYKLESQLVIDFGTQYPTMRGSKWRIHIPDPIENLDWCTHFENLIWHRGQVYGRLYFQGDSRLITGGYFQSEAEAYRVLRMLEKLSKLKENRIRVTKLTKPKRTIKGQQTRAVRASVVLFDKEGNVVKGDCWRPPRNGC